MDIEPTPGACRIVLLAPVIFAAHVVEEAPGFVEWTNSLLEDDITQQLFIAVNAAAASSGCANPMAIEPRAGSGGACLLTRSSGW